MGRRHSPTSNPRWFIITLLGIGLGLSSPVSNAYDSRRMSFIRRASATSPAWKAEIILWCSGALQCVATPMTPVPP